MEIGIGIKAILWKKDKSFKGEKSSTEDIKSH